jgi:hypothetical protein
MAIVFFLKKILFSTAKATTAILPKKAARSNHPALNTDLSAAQPVHKLRSHKAVSKGAVLKVRPSQHNALLNPSVQISVNIAGMQMIRTIDKISGFQTFIFQQHTDHNIFGEI